LEGAEARSGSVDAGESEFSRKGELILELLERSRLGFTSDMTEEDRAQLEVERQVLVGRAGWNSFSVEELEELLQKG
jgi:hypothetical protein